MSLDWQYWEHKFIGDPGYNDAEVVIPETASPVYKVIGVHRLDSVEDSIFRRVYVDVLDKNNNRQREQKLLWNKMHCKVSVTSIDYPLDKIPYIDIPNYGVANIWHRNGEGITGLKPGYSYFVVFREVDRLE
jgi:hypothetical protein